MHATIIRKKKQNNKIYNQIWKHIQTSKSHRIIYPSKTSKQTRIPDSRTINIETIEQVRLKLELALTVGETWTSTHVILKQPGI